MHIVWIVSQARIGVLLIHLIAYYMMLVEHVNHGWECILAPVGAPVPHHDSLQINIFLRLLLVELIYF
jgi:hypothetical protein